MRKVLLLLFVVFLIKPVFSQVVINEYQMGNVSTIADPHYGLYSDWIELYNTSSNWVNLTNYSITDEKNDTLKYVIPSGTTIGPKAFLILWADGKDSALHVNFKLDKNGDDITLYNANKVKVDFISHGDNGDGISIGRYTDGADLWRLFATPTPGTANNTTPTKIGVPEPIFSHKSGFYPGAISVTVTSIVSGATIRYTTDGSEPQSTSTLYSAPINITKNTVLKVRLFHANYNDSRINSQSYFINERYSQLPVVSISVDPVNMFDPVTGMYSLGPNAQTADPQYGANFWEERELPATFEYIVDGKQKVEVNGGIEIYGGWSRRFAQRSLSFSCRDIYGGERMRYKFFKEKDNDVYRQVVLRNSGSDVGEPKYRDLMLQTIIRKRMDVDYQAGESVIVYINGQYWGIMDLREKLQARYLKDNYGLEETEVDLLANYNEVLAGTDADFNSLHSFISNNSMTSSTNYNQVKAQMDVNEFMNYQIAEIFIANHDWPGYNIKYWQQHGSNTLWRWILYDADQSFAYYAACLETVNTLRDATYQYGSSWPNPSHSTVMLRKLLENTEFKNMFIQRFAAHMNTTFAADTLNGWINKFEAKFADELPYHLQRWNVTDEDWVEEVAMMRNFANKRVGLMRGFIQTYFSLTGLSTLTIESQNRLHPEFDVCGVEVDGLHIVGDYFKNVPIVVTAKVPQGMHFLRWENGSGTTLTTDTVLTITINTNTTIVAVYEPINVVQNLHINEVMAWNNTIVTDSRGEYDDWIEIYNDNDFPVDIAGLCITDERDNENKCRILADANNSTVIPAKGYIVLWADSDEAQGVLHLDFKLEANGEFLALTQVYGKDVYWLDSLRYNQQIADLSYSRSPNGTGDFVIKTSSYGINNDLVGNKTQSISLLKGWNLLSFYVKPEPNTIETAFGSALPQITIIKDVSSFYLSDQAPFLNSLKAIQIGDAYLVYAKNPVNFDVTGEIAFTGSFNLKSGWNLIGCPWTTVKPVSSVTSAITAEPEIIKDFDAFYEFGGFFNSLENFEPGKGYYILLPNNGVFNW